MITTLLSCYEDGVCIFTNDDFNAAPVVSGISETPSQTGMTTKQPTSIYDLQGRPLKQKPSKGIYIENGKKKVAQ